MNYRELLIRYMAYVLMMEGTSFTYSRLGFFSDEEWDELQRITREAEIEAARND